MASTTNWIMALSWVLSLAGYFLFNYLYSMFPELEWYQIVSFTMNLDVYWLAIFVVPVILTMIDFVVDKAISSFSPSSLDSLKKAIEEDKREEQFHLRTGGLSSLASGGKDYHNAQVVDC